MCNDLIKGIFHLIWFILSGLFLLIMIDFIVLIFVYVFF